MYSISEKENLLRFYNHEKPDHLPILSEALFTKHPFLSFLERPDDGGNKDWFGVTYMHDELTNTYVPAHDIPPVITDITKWREQLVIPDVDAMDWDAAYEIDKIPDEVRSKKVVSLLIQAGIWERMHALMGMSNAFVALIEEPEEAKALLEALGDYKCKLITKLIEYFKPDIIRQHDDYGTQISMQMNANLWREMIKPQIKRFVDVCHENGVKYEQHSCGRIEEIVPDFVEVGVDSWQGMQVNDVPRLLEVTGSALNYHMSMSVVAYQAADMAGQLTEEELRQDIRKTVIACSVNGCYFPTFASLGVKWWGIPVIQDEVDKCRELIKY